MLLILVGFAQAAVPSAAPNYVSPAYQSAVTAFGQCIGDASVSAPNTIDPAGVAKRAIAICKEKRSAMDAEFVAWVDGSQFSTADRAAAHLSYEKNMANLSSDITAAVRKRRRAEQMQARAVSSTPGLGLMLAQPARQSPPVISRYNQPSR
ncbi:hypothetical protein MOP88_03790 [Sphingomonas sp. WKB10]|nr:hypothetical protein [Sphingomonas sp. WKB10]